MKRWLLLSSCVWAFGWGHAALAVAPPGRYLAQPNRTVYDTRTKLTWQMDLDPGKYTQSQAVSFCEQLQLAGLVWRLPTRLELLTLVDPSQTQAPTIDRKAFPNTFSDQFWSSTPAAGSSGNGWRIDFSDGRSFCNVTSYAVRVRCMH